MPKQVLPTYSINILNGTPVSPKEFMADKLAHYLDEHKHLHFPHKHSFYHLVYFSKGSGTHSIDFINFRVEAGQIYFMVPGQVHSWSFKGLPDGFIVNFSEQYINALVANARYLDQFTFFSGIANEQVITIPVAGRKQVEQILATIVMEGNSTEALKDDFTRTAGFKNALIKKEVVEAKTFGEYEIKAGTYYNYSADIVHSVSEEVANKVFDQWVKVLKEVIPGWTGKYGDGNDGRSFYIGGKLTNGKTVNISLSVCCPASDSKQVYFSMSAQ